MKLNIEAFRGVSGPFTVDFDTRQNLTVLYGENGSGKTTISDAFEFVIDGTSGSLEEKSFGWEISPWPVGQCPPEKGRSLPFP